MKLRILVPLTIVAAAAACSDGGSPTAATTPPATPLADGATGGPVTGAIFTTESACDGTDLNVYNSKADVYLDGGPRHAGAAGLPPGDYYVQVTSPSGQLLGTSVGTATPQPVHVTSAGKFQVCYQLSAILKKASDGTPGYDDTPNAGGEYKVWVSTDAGFAESASKTDNFKVLPDEVIVPTWLRARKFYDANANGAYDAGEAYLTGWKMRVQDGIDVFRWTPVDMQVSPDEYLVTESDPIESNWMHTTATAVTLVINSGDDKTATFGNLCLGAGGGLTLGFWSNKNGQALVDGTDLAMLTALNLRNASGANFDPATYSSFRTWILNATATNMAYMLSAQLAAMELNVYNGKVNGTSLIYAPGTTSANALGFATVNAVMAEANTSLGTDPVTVASGSTRDYQEALKNALDKANNNLNFVQATACPFSFAE